MKFTLYSSIRLQRTKTPAIIPLPTQPCLLLSLVPLACSLFVSSVRAVTPAPDGAYVNQNTAEGAGALYNLDVYQGLDNTAVGYAALYRNQTGDSNTGVGSRALIAATGSFNTANGAEALEYTTGSENTAVGVRALLGTIDDQGKVTSTGSFNTATGVAALFSITNGTYNVADGWKALYSNSSGNYNTASGVQALFSNDDGIYNTASGVNALYSNNHGYYNTAIGVSALFSNTTGINNVASGINALFYNNGQNNTANGANALQKNTTGNFNTTSGAFGLFNNTSGASNVALGYKAGYNLTGSSNIIVGANVLGAASDANVTRIGNTTQKKTFIGGISGKTVANGVGVIINSSGQLGTIQSSARYKDDIRPMDKSSEAILALKPVTFRYKEELDPEKIPQFGLIAEQVEKVNPDLVVRDEEGKVSTVRYEAVNAMLLNEFLKEHQKVREQGDRLQKQETTIAQLKKQVELLSTGLQKVGARMELQKTEQRLMTQE